MSFESRLEDGTLICSFNGQMDTVSCSKIEKEVMEKVEAHDGKAAFDLGKVDYIASSFIRLCAKAASSVKHQNYSIINVTPPVKKVFKIAGLTDRLNIN